MIRITVILFTSAFSRSQVRISPTTEMWEYLPIPSPYTTLPYVPMRLQVPAWHHRSVVVAYLHTSASITLYQESWMRQAVIICRDNIMRQHRAFLSAIAIAAGQSFNIRQSRFSAFNTERLTEINISLNIVVVNNSDIDRVISQVEYQNAGS